MEQQLTQPRRAFLTTAASVVLAGCLGGGDAGGKGDQDIRAHPAMTGVEASPRLGPDQPVPEATVVAFSDPSCPQCARFAERTFPNLRRRFVEPGQMAYIWRALPTVEPWADRAVAALLAAHEQDEAAFWWLKTRLHRHRSSVTDKNVIDRVVSWLATRDGIDTEAVRHDVENGRFDEHLAADRRAADDSNVDAVPSFVLFRGEEFVSVVVGPHSTDVFASALDL
jgi:predicted DsbA family dithiol-disulfide isomerase